MLRALHGESFLKEAIIHMMKLWLNYGEVRVTGGGEGGDSICMYAIVRRGYAGDVRKLTVDERVLPRSSAGLGKSY